MEAMLSGIPLPALIRPAQRMTEEQFMAFSDGNRPFQMELEANGDVRIISPTGSDSSAKNSEISGELYLWNRELGGGVVLDSSGGVSLPDGSLRAADAAWISRRKWDALPADRRKRYAPVCPEFVVELRSPSDSLLDVEAKLEMWVRNGVELGWLLDPDARTVTIYRADREPERLDNVSQVAGEGPVAGFVLPLDRIFN